MFDDMIPLQVVLAAGALINLYNINLPDSDKWIISDAFSLFLSFSTALGHVWQACTFEKGGRIQGILQRECAVLETSDFEAKIRGINSISGLKLHDFEIICPPRWVRPYPARPHPPPATDLADHDGRCGCGT